MNDRLLKKLILKEIYSVLREQEEKPDLLKSLKSRLRSMNGSDDSGYGSWDEGGTEWDYDDAEGGYYHTATVNFENPKKVEVSGSDHTHKGKDKVFPLRKETDVDTIISYVESISGLSEGSSSGEEKEYDDDEDDIIVPQDDDDDEDEEEDDGWEFSTRN